MIKVAVPSRGDEVDEHFGHCESFSLFTIDEGKGIVEQVRLTPPPACGCKSNIIATLVEMGVSVMIAGNMGEGAAIRLQEQGIRTIRGASGKARDVVTDWINGRLVAGEGICHAHGHEGCGAH